MTDDRLYWYEVEEVTSVHDGDSLHARLSVGFHLTAVVALRLSGIDTPELGQENALEARDYLRSRLTEAAPGTVFVRTHKTGKYGRWLADLYIGDEYLNKTLVKKGLAVPYDGGAR